MWNNLNFRMLLRVLIVYTAFIITFYPYSFYYLNICNLHVRIWFWILNVALSLSNYVRSYKKNIKCVRNMKIIAGHQILICVTQERIYLSAAYIFFLVFSYHYFSFTKMETVLFLEIIKYSSDHKSISWMVKDFL